MRNPRLTFFLVFRAPEESPAGQLLKQSLCFFAPSESIELKPWKSPQILVKDKYLVDYVKSLVGGGNVRVSDSTDVSCWG
jgi:hypothetical protein